MKKAEFSLLLAMMCLIISAQAPLAKTQGVKWEKLGPGGGGATFIPTFAYNTPDNFLIRCDMTGSYLTRDGGASYQQINYAGGASSYAYDPNDPKTVYIGGTALNRSVDGGITWERIFPAKADIAREIFQGDHGDYRIEAVPGSLYGGGKIGNVRVEPGQSATIYLSMGSNFLYTNDSGKTWNKVPVQQSINFIYTNKTSLKEEVYIFTASAIYVFNKATHTIINKVLPKEMTPASSITGGTITKSDKVIFYAMHHNSEGTAPGDEVWKSEDSGSTWKQMTDRVVTNAAGNSTKPVYTAISCSEFEAEQAYLIASRYDENKDNLNLRWSGILKTTDSGNSWDWVLKLGGDMKGGTNLKDGWASAGGSGMTHITNVGVYPYDADIAVFTEWFRIVKTTDGGKTWNQIYCIEQPDGTFSSNGSDVLTGYGVHFDPFDRNHIAVSFTDVGFHNSFNEGKSWSRELNGIPPEMKNTCYWMVFDPAIKGKIFSVWSSIHDLPRGKMTTTAKWKQSGKGGVCISADGGKTWKLSVEGMGADSPSTSIVMDPKSAPGNRTLYVATYNKGVFKSTDDGKTWQLKNNGITDNTCAFELTLTSNGVLFLTVSVTPTFKTGTGDNRIYSGDVYRSTDGAESWTKLNVSNSSLFPNGIDYDRKNPNRIYLGCWASTARGNSTGRSDEMPGGIFMSDDNGTTWTSIFDKTKNVYDVTVDPYHPGRLYCNTFNQGAYRSDDYGKNWKKILGYDFHWGHRVIVDENNPEKVYLTTFGSSVWHGIPQVE